VTRTTTPPVSGPSRGLRSRGGLVVTPVGIVRSPFTAKFGVPRQAGLVPVRASIELDADVIEQEALRGLDGVSHVWVLWLFHRHTGAPMRATVRPPRLGGNARLGVLATRSPFRRNSIGLSAVRVLGIEGLRIDVEGLDAIDGTPVVDIKPYLPDVDAIADARVDWLEPEPPTRPVVLSTAADAALAAHPRGDELRALVVAMLAADPRPGYRRGAAGARIHGMSVLDVDVRFSIDDDAVHVHDIVR
jgi:tRNA (adenine37-N6)-methyltransferase